MGIPNSTLDLRKRCRRSRQLAWATIALLSLTLARAQTNANYLSVTNRASAPRRPSIVLIIADNVGYGDLGCYGQKKIKTPRLDKLASEGIRFTSYYTGSPLDGPARASLFTGLEPRHNGGNSDYPLPIDAFTVTAFLQKIGYHTGLMGVWNLGEAPAVRPMAKGFDEFAGFLTQAQARNYFSDTIYRQDAESGKDLVQPLPDNQNNGRGMYVPNVLGYAGNSFIRINAPDQFNHYQPFFLCLAYPIPHNGTPPQTTIYANETWPQPEKDRAEMITRMDENIGSVIDQLSALKVNTNTVVIFTSIGGPQTEEGMQPQFFQSAGPLRGEAGSVFEGGIRAPMIIRWPARIKPGQVSDYPWAAWDFFPTAAAIALTKSTNHIDGISIMPTLTGKGKGTEHESFYWESDQGGLQKAARTDGWKIVQIGTNASALYDLKTDIGEQNDLAGKHPDVLKRMESLLTAGRGEVNAR